MFKIAFTSLKVFRTDHWVLHRLNKAINRGGQAPCTFSSSHDRTVMLYEHGNMQIYG